MSSEKITTPHLGILIMTKSSKNQPLKTSIHKTDHSTLKEKLHLGMVASIVKQGKSKNCLISLCFLTSKL